MVTGIARAKHKLAEKFPIYEKKKKHGTPIIVTSKMKATISTNIFFIFLLLHLSPYLIFKKIIQFFSRKYQI